MSLPSVTRARAPVRFPATQIASSNANTLDDYEEGTWTPSLKFGGGSTGMTYGAQSGWYTKVGNTVTVSGVVVLTAKGSSTGTATLSLPIACTASYGKQGSGASGLAVNMSSLSGGVFFWPDPGSTLTAVCRTGSATGTISLTHANFADNTSLYFTIVYFVD